MIPRKLLIALLAFGTVGGFASGLASLSWRLRHGCQAERHHGRDFGHARSHIHRSWHPEERWSQRGAPTTVTPHEVSTPAVAPQASPPIHVNVTIHPVQPPAAAPAASGG